MFVFGKSGRDTVPVAVSSDLVEVSSDQRRNHLKDHDFIYAGGSLAIYAVFDGAGKRDAAETATHFFERRLGKIRRSPETVSAEQLRADAHKAIRRKCSKNSRGHYPKTTAAIGRIVHSAANPDGFGLEYAVAGDSSILVSRNSSELELVAQEQARRLPNGEASYSHFLGSGRAVFKPGGSLELGEDDWRVVFGSDAVTDHQRGGLDIEGLSEIVLNSPIKEAAANVVAALTFSPDDASVIVIGPR